MELIEKLEAERVFFSITWVTGARNKGELGCINGGRECCVPWGVQRGWGKKKKKKKTK